MDIRKLEIFCEVYRCRGYSSAAKALGLTQSAVSQQVKSLERELGTALFDRAARQSPTAAGDYLYNEGAGLLARIADVENGVRHASGLGGGTVRFGMIDVAATQLLPRALHGFKDEFPQVEVEAVVKTSGDLIEMVEGFELDFAVVVTNNVPETIQSFDIYEDSIVAVVRKGSTLERKGLSVADLKGEPLILYPTSAHSRILIDEVLRSNGVVPTVGMEMHYPAAIISLVEQGMGVGLVSELSTREVRTRKVSFVAVDELNGVRRIGVSLQRGRRPSPQARALMETIKKARVGLHGALRLL